MRLKTITYERKGYLHPGQKPNPFLIRGAKAVIPEIDRLIGGDVAKAVSEEIKRQLKDIKVDVKI